jgi:hypothetical protein
LRALPSGVLPLGLLLGNCRQRAIGD